MCVHVVVFLEAKLDAKPIPRNTRTRPDLHKSKPKRITDVEPRKVRSKAARKQWKKKCRSKKLEYYSVSVVPSVKHILRFYKKVRLTKICYS